MAYRACADSSLCCSLLCVSPEAAESTNTGCTYMTPTKNSARSIEVYCSAAVGQAAAASLIAILALAATIRAAL